ncbi:MAG: hypothetical protein ACREYE_05365 [Gammaproteobacteria bacterium]
MDGKRIYIATTAGGEYILGASVVGAASEAASTDAYAVFADEVKAVDQDYAPETVHTDGWPAPQGAEDTVSNDHGDPGFPARVSENPRPHH